MRCPGQHGFFTFDLGDSFYQLEVEERDREKTSFICRGGQYKFIRMPMGLMISGASMQRLVDLVLSGLSYTACLAYVDDLIVYARSLDEHFERLRLVLSRICQAGLKIKPSKTVLVQKSVGFLGHLVSAAGVQAHPEDPANI
jgi:hypothetical protein